MKISNKILSLLAIGILSISMVACSQPKTETPKDNNTAPVEDKTTTEETKKEEIVLVDDDNAKVVITEKKKDLLGASYVINVENKLDKKIIVQARDISVNGMMEDAIFSIEVTPGKKANGTMTFTNIDGIENLKNTEGKIVILGEDFMEISSYDMKID